jgi:hypothetical protein
VLEQVEDCGFPAAAAADQGVAAQVEIETKI